jgi:hypothetical protein
MYLPQTSIPLIEGWRHPVFRKELNPLVPPLVMTSTVAAPLRNARELFIDHHSALSTNALKIASNKPQRGREIALCKKAPFYFTCSQSEAEPV